MFAAASRRYAPSILSKPRRFYRCVVAPKKSTKSPRFSTVPDASLRPAPLAIGILRETYNSWERRAPLTPQHVHDFLKEHPGSQVFVQPCHHRIFSNQEYQQAGAVVQDDLAAADLILGVKRPKAWPDFRQHNDVTKKKKHQTYLLFSHVIKGQPENMDLLQQALTEHISFLDYECIVRGGMQTTTSCRQRKAQRLVAFGKYAGMAGMLDTWSILGRQLLQQGFSTPFLNSSPSIYHHDLHHAKESVKEMGQIVATEGLPAEMDPIVVAMTGPGGKVHQGVREIFDLVPHEMVSVQDLPQIHQEGAGHPQYKIYGVAPTMAEIYEHTSGRPFDRDDFQNNPQNYACHFARRVAPYSSVLMNCVYWDDRFPRLLTKEDMRYLCESGQNRLLVVSDISCDVNGSIEFLDRSTTIDQPCYQYDPITGEEVQDGDTTKGVAVMGVDILPTELPVESSTHFGNALMDVMQDFCDANTESGIDASRLPHRLSNAMITTVEGKLSPNFHYLESIMKRTIKQQQESLRYAQQESMVLLLEGHLFDSGLINQVLDVLEAHQCSFQFKECHVRHQPKHPVKSTAILKITGPLEEAGNTASLFHKVESKIGTLVLAVETADATVRRMDTSASSTDGGGGRSWAYTEDPSVKTVLLLGSGRVSKSVADLLGRTKARRLIVASDDESQAREVADYAQDGHAVGLDVANDRPGLTKLVQQADVVISLLPVPMHPAVAELCINSQTHLVTASYESDEMRMLNQRAKNANVTILNEAGLDPGLDHMSTMRLIDCIRDRGGTVTSYSSVCGGLPAPEAADNPLKYKFSWSPRGVIAASQAPAKYRWEDHVVQVPGKELLVSSAPFLDAWPDLQLECLPNRDSLQYGKTYGIGDTAKTMFRGTLRYRGFSQLMNVYQNMGLFENETIFLDNDGATTTWGEVLEDLRVTRGGFESMADFLLGCAEDDQDDANRARECLEWLGVCGDAVLPTLKNGGATVLDVFCRCLEEKLYYGSRERDMVVMHHTIGAEFLDGTKEEHHSSLQIFGDRSMTAMCKTVGYTAAAAAELVLEGNVDTGLMLPTEKHVYNPILATVKREGIVFDETVHVEEPTDMQSHAM